MDEAEIKRRVKNLLLGVISNATTILELENMANDIVDRIIDHNVEKEKGRVI